MTQPEAKFKKRLIKAYTARYPKGWHYYAQANRKLGVPDLYFTVQAWSPVTQGAPTLVSRGVWIEAKVRPNPASKLQLRVHEKMRAAGNIVLVVTLENPDAPLMKQRVWTADVAPRHQWFATDLASESFWHRMLQ